MVGDEFLFISGTVIRNDVRVLLTRNDKLRRP